MQDLTEAPMVAMGGVRCPKCEEDIVVGMGVHAPQTLYAVKYNELKKKTEDFMELIEKSSMSEEEKENMRNLYGKMDVIEPTQMANMTEILKSKYSGVKLG